MILNLTQHVSTTFENVTLRAQNIAEIAVDHGVGKAMIGGAPFLMHPLVEALTARGIEPVFAFSVRNSVEQAQPDGSVKKINVFLHAGFVSGTS